MILGSINITTGVPSALTMNPQKILSALAMGMLAADPAGYLVSKGVPFREAHRTSGAGVSLAEGEGLSGIDQWGLDKPKFILWTPRRGCAGCVWL
jgi:argininosuccinate lyase